MELHIFDFDGTLFNSPTPSLAQAERFFPGHGSRLCQQLINSVWNGGYGWFQNLHTLEPPAVPRNPNLGEWYVTPVLEHLKTLLRASLEENGSLHDKGGVVEARVDPDRQRSTTNGAGPLHSSSSSSSSSFAVERGPPSRLFFILTGRDRKFTARIMELLEHAGVLSSLEGVFLKPHESYGTVRFKLETFADLIQQYCPQRVWYYEDRPEQGGKLLEGIRSLQKILGDAGALLEEEEVSFQTKGAEPTPVSVPIEEKKIPSMKTVCAARAFPFEAVKNGLQPCAPELSWRFFFQGNQQKAEKAKRYGDRWAESYLQGHRMLDNTSGPRGNQKIAGRLQIAPNTRFKEFEFIMVLLEPVLGLGGETVLSDEAFSQLMDLLGVWRG